ncbi:MAG: electron transfer flavoprotein subunit alpha/FixB family protein, partial [Geminicoccaceae bacterium]
ARELAASGGGQVAALVVGPNGAAHAADSLARGAAEVLVAGGAAPEPVGAEALAVALDAALRDAGPGTVLIGATRTGAEVAARVAQGLALPCASDCMSFRPEGNGLLVERRVYGGRFVARQVLEGRPRILTVSAKRFAMADKTSSPADGRIRPLAIELPAPRVRPQAVASRSPSAVDVTKADVIVAAGRGVKQVEDLAQLERLAKALGGVLAGSRPLTGDLDWLPVDRRIGLSGQTVKPNLYIACGISGQIEHLVGIKGARTVVAINNDPKAPIHAEADYSIVGDLYEIVPALIQQCERAVDGTR